MVMTATFLSFSLSSLPGGGLQHVEQQIEATGHKRRKLAPKSS
jgi:hypothetical protein